MADQNLDIIIEAKDKATPEIQKVDKSLKDVEKTTGKVSTSVGGMGLGFGKMAGAVGLGTIAAQGAAAALSSLGGFLKSTVTEALNAETAWADYSHMIAQGAQASSDQINMLREQAEAIGDVGGISEEVAMKIQSTSAEYNLSSEAIAKLTPTIVDYVASQNGMNASIGDAKMAANGFGKALQGQMEIVTKAGFTYTEAQLKLLKTGTEMERVTTLNDILGKSYDGTNEALGNTVEGSMRRFDNKIDDIKKNIGGSLLPALQLFMDTATDAADKVENTTKKNDQMARSFYMGAGVVKALGFVLLGVAKIIGTLALAFTVGATTSAAFAGDVIKHLKSVGISASQVFEGLKKGFSGDFKGAYSDLSKGLKLAQFDFSSTALAASNAQMAIVNAEKGIGDSFSKAGEAIKESYFQTEFKAISEVSTGLKDKTKENFEAMGNAASKAGDKFKDASKKLIESSKDIAESLDNVSKDYIKKSSDMFDAFQKKVSDINKEITEQNAQYEKDNADAKKQYQDEALASYIGHQDTIKELNKQIADQEKGQTDDQTKSTQKLIDLQEKLNVLKLRQSEQGGSASASSRASLADQIKDTENAISEIQKGGSADSSLADLKTKLEAEKTLISQYVGEFADIEKLAEEERKKTDLDRMKARFEEENTARTAEHTKRLADLQAKMDEEKALYEKNKQELIVETADKYAKIGEKLNEGWNKMKEDTKGHVKEMKALEEQVLAIKASIEAARSAVKSGAVGGGSVAGAQPRADGGPVFAGRPYVVGERGPELFMPNSSGTIIPNGGAAEIHIMEGAQVSVGSRGDMESLADVVAQRLARVLQSQRNGLATAM